MIQFCKNKDKTVTNVLQTADRGLGEMAYDVNHATALLLLYIEIVATASQLVDTLLYLYNTSCWIIFLHSSKIKILTAIQISILSKSYSTRDHIFDTFILRIQPCIVENIYLLRTCVPNVLHPNISAGSKKQPMHRDEKEANHVWCECNTNKKYREGLKERRETMWFHTYAIMRDLYNLSNYVILTTYQALIFKGIVNASEE